MDNAATEFELEAVASPDCWDWVSVLSNDNNATGVAEQPDGGGYHVPEGPSSTLADGTFESDNILVPEKTPDDAPEGVDIPGLLTDDFSESIKRIQRNLREDREDAGIDGEVAPTDAAVETCMKLTRCIAPRVVLKPRLRWAAFTEETGGVSLVLQSLVTDRRLNYQISPDGTRISAIRIDEYMRSESFVVSVDDEEILRERTAWVVNRA